MTLLTDELRALIGRQVDYVAPEELGLASARYFARAVGDNNPLYTSPAAALAAGLATTIVPPTLVFETNQLVDLPRDDDGFAGHTWPISVPGTRAVRGGHRYLWHRDVLPGDVLAATWTITDVTERTTRAGQPMVVVTSHCRYATEAGEPVAEQTETLLYVAVAPVTP